MSGVTWSNLPRELLISIAELLDNGEDIRRFRAVCSSWLASCPLPKPLRFPLKLPFPIFPSDPVKSTHRGHFILLESTIYRLEPILEPNRSAETAGPSRPNGWLIRLQETAQQGKFRVLNPFELAQINYFHEMYPKVLNLFNFRVSIVQKAYNLAYVDLGGNERIQLITENEPLHVQKVILSRNNDEHIVLAIYDGGLVCGMKLEDNHWTAIDGLTDLYWNFRDIIDFKGKFFAVSSGCDVAVLDYSFNVIETIDSPSHVPAGDVHLIESFGELFLVVRNFDTFLSKLSYDGKTRSYVRKNALKRIKIKVKVYKLNEVENQWEEVHNLGDRVLFVGEDCNWSVSAQDFAGSKGNCIYFFDAFRRENCKEDAVLRALLDGSGVDIRVYDLEEGTGGPLAYYPGSADMFWPPPPWLEFV